MSTTMPHVTPHTPQKPAPAVTPPQPSSATTASPLPSPKRNEMPRNRLADSRALADGTRGLDADGMFFEQLLVPASTGQGNPSGAGGGASSFSMFAPLDGVPTQLIDELALQLPRQGSRPFSATLLMPNLGKVQIRAHKRDSHWAIDLAFERGDVLDRLKRHHQACEDAFSQALELDVELSLQPAGDA